MDDINLFNAAVVGENSEAAFLVEEKKLHAVDRVIAAHKNEQSKLGLVVPMMMNALKALMQFAEGKVPFHSLDKAKTCISGNVKDPEQIACAIENIYTHLPHNDRLALSSKIHHAYK